MHIIVKNYSHMNHALGKYIKNKSEYDYAMKSGGFVSSEKGHQLAESKRKSMEDKKYTPSKECVAMMNTVLGRKDKRIRLSEHPRLVDGMKKLGVKFDIPDWCPTHYKEK